MTLPQVVKAEYRGGHRIRLTFNDGRVQAALEGADRASLAIGMNPAFLEIMERSRAAHREQGGISPEEMRRHFGIKSKKAAKRRAAR